MRGPMVSNVVQQLSQLVEWEELDYLIVDMPPGTGDIAITLCQKLSLAGAVIVSTPQKLSLVDVAKGIDMFAKTQVPCMALVYNMAFFDGDDGKRYFPFGVVPGPRDAGESSLRLAASLPTFTLPIHPSLSDDTPVPAVIREVGPSDPIRPAFASLADHVVRAVIRQAAPAATTTLVFDEPRGTLFLRTIRSDGAEQVLLSPERVRKASKAADSGDPRSVPATVRPTAIVPVGNYGVQISWSDGHDASIYSFDDLRALAS